MPWVAGGVVPATGKNRAKAAVQREEGDMRCWSVAERIQGWEVGDKSCVRSGRKMMAVTGLIDDFTAYPLFNKTVVNEFVE